jgi:hypothetical protein
MTAPTAEALEQRARTDWDKTRPIGMPFWHELPPSYRARLAGFHAAGVAAERERAAGVETAARALLGFIGTGGMRVYHDDKPVRDLLAAIRQEPQP